MAQDESELALRYVRHYVEQEYGADTHVSALDRREP